MGVEKKRDDLGNKFVGGHMFSIIENQNVQFFLVVVCFYTHERSNLPAQLSFGANQARMGVSLNASAKRLCV